MGLLDWLKSKPANDSLSDKLEDPEFIQQAVREAFKMVNDENEARDAEIVDQAVSLIKERDFSMAYELLQGVISRIPPNYVNQYEEEGKIVIKLWDMTAFIEYIAWMKSKWMESKEKEKEIIWKLNAYPRAFYYLGFILFEARDFENADRYLRLGLKLEPENSTLLNEKAQALVGLEKMYEALALYETVISSRNFVTTHEKAVALRGKGFVLIETGALEMAEDSFKQSLKYEPDSPLAAKELRYIEQLRSNR